MIDTKKTLKQDLVEPVTHSKKMDDSKIRYYVIFFCVSVTAIGFVLFNEVYLDHKFYLLDWQAITQGKNAWENSTNAYGPTHNGLVILHYFHVKLPWLFYVILWLITCGVTSNFLIRNQAIDKRQKLLLHLCIFFNPLLWFFVVEGGGNDMLMAFFVILSFYLYRKNEDFFSGVSMAIAIGVKFLPIVAVPFLIFSRKKIRWKYTYALILSLVLFFGISYFLWGEQNLNPFQYAMERRSKILSGFRFLRGCYSPLLLFSDKPNIDWLSTWMIGASITSFFYFHIRYQLENILSAIIALGLVVLLFKVGHHQFFITFITSLLFWISSNDKNYLNVKKRVFSFNLFFSMIATVSIIFRLKNSPVTEYFGQFFPHYFYNNIIGLPVSLITALILFHLIQYSLSIRKSNVSDVVEGNSKDPQNLVNT